MSVPAAFLACQRTPPLRSALPPPPERRRQRV